MNDKHTNSSLKSLLEQELANEAIAIVEEKQKRAETTQPVLIQEATDFSESIVWDLQRQYYTEQGAKAWSEGIVPHYITSSSYMSKAYAQLVYAWLKDQMAAGHSSLRILELGAGSGQFSFHFLKHISKLWYQHHPETENLPFTYVMSDIARENIKFWHSHPAFQHWYASGILDSACFDVEKDQHITLDKSQEHWNQNDQKGPILVIANYLFDTIRQDYWQIENGQVAKIQVATYQSKDSEKESLQRLQYEFSTDASAKVYQNESLQQLLYFYETHLEAGMVSIPNYGKACLDRIRSWSSDQLTLISGDKGVIDWEEFLGVDYPSIATHGSISTRVNFHALHWLTAHEKGRSWFCGRPSDDFKIGAFVWGDTDNLTSFGKQCEEFAYQFNPDDQFVLKKIIEANYSKLSITEIMSYLRFSEFDPKALKRAIPRLMELVNTISKAEIAALDEIIPQTWDNYYSLGEPDDLAFALGSFYYEIDAYHKALWFFERSIELYGSDEGTIANIRNCQKLIQIKEQG